MECLLYMFAGFLIGTILVVFLVDYHNYNYNDHK